MLPSPRRPIAFAPRPDMPSPRRPPPGLASARRTDAAPTRPAVEWRPTGPAASSSASASEKQRLLRLQEELLAQSARFSTACTTMKDDLALTKLKEHLLQDRVHAPDTNQKLQLRLTAAEAELAELRRILVEQSRRSKQLSTQNVKLQLSVATLREKYASERAARERLTREFNASRLALLLRLAHAKADTNSMRRDASSMLEYAMEVVGSEDPRMVPGYREAFGLRAMVAASSTEPPAAYDDMFSGPPGGGIDEHVPSKKPPRLEDAFVGRPGGGIDEHVPGPVPPRYEDAFVKRL